VSGGRSGVDVMSGERRRLRVDARTMVRRGLS
jgi:hypothetical protein